MYDVKFQNVFVERTSDFRELLFAMASEVMNSINVINKTMFSSNNFFQYQNLYMCESQKTTLILTLRPCFWLRLDIMLIETDGERA